MGKDKPRLRMFAGPNGSGKSTLKDAVDGVPLGFYVNPDEIEKLIRTQQYFDLRGFQIETTSATILKFFCASEFLIKQGLLPQAQQLRYEEGRLYFDKVQVNSYFASVLSDFIRNEFLQSGTSFTFETVMSSPDKVAFLKKAQDHGFRSYLYYVATESADINIDRVKIRVGKGGHDVPEKLIRKRYDNSLGLLFSAIQYSNRAYIFDNTSEQRIFLAEITDGVELEMQTDSIPNWFKTALLDKFQPADNVPAA